MDRTPRILMCPPDFYGIEYEINPWMSRQRGAAPERAQAQWRRLYETLLGLGAEVELMIPQPGLPPRGPRPGEPALRRLVRLPRLRRPAPAGGLLLRGRRRRPVLRAHPV